MAQNQPSATVQEYIINPPKGLVGINLPEIWRYRDLFLIFVWRDIKVRYKQTILGIAWAIFQPFITMIIFSVFFGRLAGVPSDNIPYPIFVYSGLLFWNYFSNALTNASNSLIENEGIVKKVYFPRLILPISTTITPLIDFAFALVVLFGLMIYYHFTPSVIGIILTPLFLIVGLFASAGLGLFLAAINSKYRDVRYALPFFIQIMMFVTPVIYPVSIIPPKFQWLLFLNPMSGIITAARASILQTTNINWQHLTISLGVSVVVFVLGIIHFRKNERFFADIL